MMNLDMTPLRYVLFDWDNTLAATRPLLVHTVNRVLQEYGLPAWDVVKQRRDKNLSFRDNFPYIFGVDKAAAAYARYTELYLPEIPRQIQTFPYVREVLSFFRSRRVPLLVVSNKDSRLLDVELRQLFDPACFLRVIAGHQAPRDKPFPEHIYYALDGLLSPSAMTPQNVWMIGDSAQDSDCALAAGVRPIRLGQPIWQDDERTDRPVTSFNDFAAFYQALTRSNC